MSECDGPEGLVWVDHDYPARECQPDRCNQCGSDMILTHHCNEAVMQRRHFPDEPVLMLNGYVVPVDLCRPIRALLAEIARLAATRHPD